MVLRFYPALLSQEDGTDFGVVFRDLPGCVTSGETLQEAAANAAQTLSLHIDGMRDAGEVIPPPSAPDVALPDWLADGPDHTVTRVLVPIEMPGRSVRTNITLDEGLLARLDAAATRDGMSRSGYIAQAIRERLRTEAR